MKFYLILLFIVIIINPQLKSKEVDYLKDCWIKQVIPLNDKYFEIKYLENKDELEHNTKPFELTHYSGHGKIFLHDLTLIKIDFDQCGRFFIL